MKSAKGRVTVVVPTLNEENTVADIIEGCRPYADEILVVDGHSQDKTREIAEGLGIKVILDNKKGKGAALRHVVNFVSGDIIVFIDSDVAIPPDAISKVYQRFTEHPALLAIGGIYSDNTKQLNFISDFKNLDHAYRGLLNPQYVKYLGSLFLAVKKEPFLKVGGFST